MNFTVATKNDIDDICELLCELFSQEAEFKPQKHLQEKALNEIIKNPNMATILIAKKEGKIVAMINLLYTISTALGSKVALLEDMIVKEEYRDKNIGSKLITFAKEFAKENGCKRITLLTDNDNIKAHNFYQKNGFEKSVMIPFRLNL
jgi:GNAT superfamily N-acetyltransferase